MVNNIIYAAETPFGNGKDWTIFVVAPSGGAAQVSFDEGLTWITSSEYNNTFGAFELKCQDGEGSEWGTGDCAPIDGTGVSVIRARKQGDTTHKLFVIGQGRQLSTEYGFGYSYSAYCEGESISFTIAAQYSEDGDNNYQLTQEGTQKIQASVSGQFLSVQGEYSNGCPDDICHWLRIFQKVTMPVSLFPINIILSDSSSAVSQWSDTIDVEDIGDPCTSAFTPEDPCLCKSDAPEWVDTGVRECVDGLKMVKFKNMNVCYTGDDYEWRITGKCKKCKKGCKDPCVKVQSDCGCGK